MTLEPNYSVPNEEETTEDRQFVEIQSELYNTAIKIAQLRVVLIQKNRQSTHLYARLMSTQRNLESMLRPLEPR